MSVLHVRGIDGVALPSFASVLDDSNGAAEMAAAALLRVHLTTFMAWLIVSWVGASLFLGVATLLEPDKWKWLGWMLVLVAAALGLASTIVTALEGQLTTLSEPLLFPPFEFPRNDLAADRLTRVAAYRRTGGRSRVLILKVEGRHCPTLYSRSP